MAVQAISFSDAVNTKGVIEVYGTPVTQLDVGDQELYSGYRGGISFAQIKAYRFLAMPCRHLPKPVLLAVIGDGIELTEKECDFAPGTVKKWSLPVDGVTLAVESTKGNVVELLDEVALRGVNGGISIENPHADGTKLCATIHIWAKIDVLGIKKSFDEHIPVCIDVGHPCITVWDIGWARLQVCYKAPTQLCGQVCIGYGPISKCWDACVSIPIRTTAGLASCECSS